jgi:uncharacterized protein YoaH (UPF0181 family)
MPNLQNLTNAKEQVVVMYILKLVAQGESPRLTAITNIANYLQEERGLAPISL